MKILTLLAILCSLSAFAATELVLEKKLSEPHKTGLVKPKNWKKLAPWVMPDVTHAAPMRFDWRDEVSCVPAIKDQGQCGSCWAFGTTEAEEWALAIDKVCVMLSPQEILSCSRKGSCGGGYFAHDYQKNPGASLETEFPYKARDLACKKGLSHDYKIVSWNYVGNSNAKTTTDMLKAALVQYGPLAVTVTANSAMQRYKSGVFKGSACAKGQTNHIVLLVGYDDQTQTWLMQNSWGVGWGEKGYMKIAYGCSRIGEDATFVTH